MLQFLYWLGNCQFVRKGAAAWSWWMFARHDRLMLQPAGWCCSQPVGVAASRLMLKPAGWSWSQPLDVEASRLMLQPAGWCCSQPIGVAASRLMLQPAGWCCISAVAVSMWLTWLLHCGLAGNGSGGPVVTTCTVYFHCRTLILLTKTVWVFHIPIWNIAWSLQQPETVSLSKRMLRLGS